MSTTLKHLLAVCSIEDLSCVKGRELEKKCQAKKLESSSSFVFVAARFGGGCANRGKGGYSQKKCHRVNNLMSSVLFNKMNNIERIMGIPYKW